MPAFAWPEGKLYLYTGSSPPPDAERFVEGLQANLRYEYDNRAMVNGHYVNLVIGKRADVTWTQYYFENEWIQMMDAQVNTHLYIAHTAMNMPSAGFYLYSGRMEQGTVVGREADLLRVRHQYFSNEWSSYG